jgi:hypothetical protein
VCSCCHGRARPLECFPQTATNEASVTLGQCRQVYHRSNGRLAAAKLVSRSIFELRFVVVRAWQRWCRHVLVDRNAHNHHEEICQRSPHCNGSVYAGRLQCTFAWFTKDAQTTLLALQLNDLYPGCLGQQRGARIHFTSYLIFPFY